VQFDAGTIAVRRSVTLVKTKTKTKSEGSGSSSACRRPARRE
jgi:hypothetical protein